MNPLKIVKAGLVYLNGWKNYFSFYSSKAASPRLLVDITELRQQSIATGVQRVTKCILEELKNKNLSLKICPVYAKAHGGGFFTASDNRPLQLHSGDFFFGLDLSCYCTVMNQKFLFKMKQNKIPVWFFIHDMIPVLFPQTVEAGMVKQFPKWLNLISQFDGVIGNSQATIDDYKNWLKTNNFQAFNNQKLDFSHLGSFFKKQEISRKTSLSPSFLMVSTVEPRKKYEQAVCAFDLLWKENIDCTLTIVGKKGWNNQKVFSLIELNPQFNKKLFWYNSGISDTELQEQYKNADCVLITSMAEGFGLPVVEAASYSKPLILRKLPVFEEIAGDSVTYFEGMDSQDLAREIKLWIKDWRLDAVPLPQVKTNTWEECTNKICNILQLS